MQKKVIALAVAGAMFAPLAAQAEVKVSGLLQAELVNFGGDGTTMDGLYLTDGAEAPTATNSTGAGRGNAGGLFISADHDLGNGMKGFAKVGFNVSTDAGDIGTPGARDNYVGLSAGFGTIIAGTFTGPYKASTVKWDPFLTTSLQARGNWGMSGLHNSYTSDAVAYSNNFGSIKAAVAYVTPESSGTGTVPDPFVAGTAGWEASVTMPAGPVELALAAENDGNATATKIAAKYSAGSIGVVAQLENLPANGPANSTATDATQMYVGGTLKMGAGKIGLGYGSYNNTTDRTYMAVGYMTELSKAVSTHIGYRSAGASGAEVTALAAGMRVKF